MTVSALLSDLFSRPVSVAHDVLEGLGPEAVNYRPAPRANSIGWLLWHGARQQDAQLAPLTGGEEAWTREGWYASFGFAPEDMGFGQDPGEAAAMSFDDPDLLRRYVERVGGLAQEYVQMVKEGDLDTVVDTSWDPPVTLGVRLVSIADDAAQHAGQAAYLKGLLGR